MRRAALTAPRTPPIVGPGVGDRSQVADSFSNQIDALEQRLDQLLAVCARLREENRVLKESQANLNAEKASLLEKNELARSRIEAMISRLRAMEQ